MTDETDSEFDPEDDVVEFDNLSADDLYGVMEEARLLDMPAMEARVEIERRHVLEYDDYRPTFSTEELFQMGVALMDAKAKRHERGETHRADTIDDLANTFLDGMGDEEMDLEIERVDGETELIDDDER